MSINQEQNVRPSSAASSFTTIRQPQSMIMDQMNDNINQKPQLPPRPSSVVSATRIGDDNSGGHYQELRHQQSEDTLTSILNNEEKNTALIVSDERLTSTLTSSDGQKKAIITKTTSSSTTSHHEKSKFFLFFFSFIFIWPFVCECVVSQWFKMNESKKRKKTT